MITAWDRFRCMKPIKPDDEDSLELKAKMKHARGSIHMDARRWEAAALDFREAAMSGANRKGGATSAVLYLEVLTMLGTGM
jgi:hypothetical protein